MAAEYQINSNLANRGSPSFLQKALTFLYCFFPWPITGFKCRAELSHVDEVDLRFPGSMIRQLQIRMANGRRQHNQQPPPVDTEWPSFPLE
jgi:hypothetical protein